MSVVESRLAVVILGSTGSIGRQAIEVIAAHPERFKLVGLVAGHDQDAVAQQAAQWGVTSFGVGTDAACRLAAHEEADVVLNAVVGAAGLRASVAALQAGKRLALANKESLVAGGDVCRRAAASGATTIVPVDSEHAAIAQCLRGVPRSQVSGIVLTASGGPFRLRRDLGSVEPQEALAHPTWNMGRKITVDCATLMNKGLEVIEAHHLFDFSYEDIDVVVHPQSVVHGAVAMADGSMLLQAAPTDMRLPIQAALAGELLPGGFGLIDLARVGELTFEPVDQARFPALGLAYEAGRRGRSYPAALNAANEEAVQAFLEHKIRFTDIAAVVERVLADHDPIDVPDLDAVLEADAQARSQARLGIADRLVHATTGAR